MTREKLESIVEGFCAGPYFPHLSPNPDAKELLVDLAEKVASEHCKELTQAKADLDVLAEEVREWRAGHLRVKPLRGPTGGGNPVFMIHGNVGFTQATDASGALSRAGGK